MRSVTVKKSDDPEMDAALVRFDALRPANDDAPAPITPPIKKSKTATARPRRSLERDRRNVSILEGFVPDVRPAVRERAGEASVAAPLPPSDPSSSTKMTTKRARADKSDTRKAPAWRYTTEIIRGASYIRTVSTTGAGLSWSLNLGGTVLKAANDDATRFMGGFQDRLSKALKAEFGEARDFFFAIETTPAGRPHLHGAVDCTENDRERLEAVLARCGGAWGSAHHKERQAHAGVLWGPDGWVRYTLKGMARTKRLLRLKAVLCVTRGCRSRAAALWEASRLRPAPTAGASPAAPGERPACASRLSATSLTLDILERPDCPPCLVCEGYETSGFCSASTHPIPTRNLRCRQDRPTSALQERKTIISLRL